MSRRWRRGEEQVKMKFEHLKQKCEKHFRKESGESEDRDRRGLRDLMVFIVNEAVKVSQGPEWVQPWPLMRVPPLKRLGHGC